MKSGIATLLMAAGLCLLAPSDAVGQEVEPVLDSYTVTHGGSGGAAGLTAVLFDESLGNGTATTRIVFRPAGGRSQLLLRVARHVRPGEVTFALLVFRIEIRGDDAGGESVYSRDLDGFTFGDSRSGHWFQRLDDLPADIAQLTVTFVGNYE